jgi:zinc/manganese transport system permease protein
MTTEPQLSWNVLADVHHLFDFPFMVNAMRAGTIVALLAGVIGWLMVVRRQTFAGHTLALIGFPGAAAATLLGISVMYGFFAFCVAGAVLIAVLPRRGGTRVSEESAIIGTVQAAALGAGFVFVTLYHGNLNGLSALLFGSYLGITPAQVIALLSVAFVATVVVVAIGRPLLFASIDPATAATNGVPVRLLSVAFLVVLGLAAAEASQITGSLLVFALLVLPAATAQRMTARPSMGIAASVGIALAVSWIGLGVAYYTTYPIGFWVTTLAFGAYVVATVGRRFVAA